MKLENLGNKLIVVAGGGYFGTKAAIFGKDVHARVVVVDNRVDCKASKFVDKTVEEMDTHRSLNTRPGSAILFVCDAVEFLVRLMKIAEPSFIVPAIPGNLAGRVVKGWLEKEGLIVESNPKALRNVSKDIPEGLIQDFNEEVGVISTSYMFKGRSCRVPCDQPSDFCPTTSRSKMGPMHQILSFATHKKLTASKVLVSHMLGEEAGCFRVSELTSFLSDIGRIKTPYSIAIGTACNCHGILNLFSIQSS